MMKTNRLYFAALFTSSLVGWTIGNGLLPILPVYAAELNISATQTGIYLALAFIALLLGTVAAGIISDRRQRQQRLLFVVGIASVPAVYLMGLATQYWTLVLITCVVWFLGGMGIALVSILASLLATSATRGAAFGVVALTSALGALLGGATIGPIADRWGFPTMFAALAAFTLLLPLASLFLPKEYASQFPGREKTNPGRLPKAFTILMIAIFLGSYVRFSGQFVTSLIMNERLFSATAVSGTAAVGSAGAIPVIILLGWLADRYNRKLLLAICYAAGLVGFAVLAFSLQLWQYWLAAVFLAVLGYGPIAIGAALVSDIVPPAVIGLSLALFNGLLLAGGIIGFAATGFVLQQFGAAAVYALGILFSLLAGLILSAVPSPQVQNR